MIQEYIGIRIAIRQLLSQKKTYHKNTGFFSLALQVGAMKQEKGNYIIADDNFQYMIYVIIVK